MLATRIDQENVLHERAAAAAGKPLNGNKTPGHKSANPKTPFRVPLNDENAVVRGGPAGKSVSKNGAQENATTVGKKMLNTAYVTPGPRNRTALGNKTTNAKAKPRLEQSPLKTVGKSGSPRLRRPKIKVLAAAETVQKVEDDEVEIEYMPPSENPLLDFPIDSEFPLTKEFPQLKPENLTKGWASVYLNQQDGRLEREQAKFQARQAALSEAQLNSTMESVFNEIDASVRRDLGLPLKEPVKRSVVASKTILSKSAATTLSKQRSVTPSVQVSNVKSKQISAAQQQLRQSVAIHKQRDGTALPVSSSRVPSTASHGTLGYARGRAISARGASDRKLSAASIFRDTRPRNLDSDDGFDRAVKDVVDGLRKSNLVGDVAEDDTDLGGRVPSALEMDEEWDGFELPMPQSGTG